jgi:glycosyltransferase involved in cell wall biosynthesis
MRKLKIALLSPFHGGSHKQWAENLKANSFHEIDIYSMPAVYWKWRMHSAVIYFAELLKNSNYPPYDIIIGTDMMNLSAFRSLVNPYYQEAKLVLYVHENQLTYPWSEVDPDPGLARDRHYGFINYISALSADHILFNSNFHKVEFINALPDFLNGFPDYSNFETIDQIESKSLVIQPGISIHSTSFHAEIPKEKPVVLWNHRWEYDKNPESFYNALQYLRHHKVEFQLILLGASFTQSPPAYEKIKMHFSQQLLHEGYVHNRSEYLALIEKADILPVCNKQEFFGISTIEAIASGVYPILPNSLVYPEHIPAVFHEKYLYNDDDELNLKLLDWIKSPKTLDREVWDIAQAFRWEIIIDKYDDFFTSAAQNNTTLAG